MISPLEICRLTTVKDAALQLPALVSAYGANSDQFYGPGTSRIAREDRGQPILVFWPTFPVTAKTEFLGPIPTVENLHDVEVQAWFAIEQPRQVWQSALRDRDVLTMEEFCQELGTRIRNILVRLACEYSVSALVLGRAHAEAQNRLHEELNRIYSCSGFAVSRVSIQSIKNHGAVLQQELLVKRVQGEAEQQGIAYDAALRGCKQRLTKAVESGCVDAKAALDSLAIAEMLREPEAPPADAENRVVVDQRQPAASIELKPILADDGSQPQDKFAVLSRLQKPRYFALRHASFTLGSGSDCDICLPSDRVGVKHASIARVGARLAVSDHNTAAGTVFEGRFVTQQFLATGDAIRLGDYWLLFNLQPRHDLGEADRNAGLACTAEHSLELAASGDACVNAPPIQLIAPGGRSIATDARPLFIGHDALCAVRIPRTAGARFHAVVFWDLARDESGKVERKWYVEDLHSEQGTALNGQRVQRALVGNGDTLEIGGYRFELRC